MSNLVKGFRRANEQDVRGVNDLPAPILKDGVPTIVLDPRQYVQNNDINSEFPIAPPIDGGLATWKTINRASWNYTGTDACFRDLEANGFIELNEFNEFQAPNGAMLDMKVKSGGQWGIQAFGLPRFTNCKSLGTVEGSSGLNMFFGSLTDFEDGLVIKDSTFIEYDTMFVDGNSNQVLNYDGQTVNFTRGETVTGGTSGATGVVQFDRDDGASGKLTLSSVSGVFQDDEALTGSSTGVAVVNGVLENMVIFTVEGTNTTGPVNFFSLDWFSKANQTLFDIKKEIETNVDTISLLNNRAQITEMPQAFAPDSLDQTNVKVIGDNNTFFPNSTVKGKLEITDNALVTDLVTQNVPVPINATWADGTIEERLCFQDFCTFDNTTNTITSVNNVLAGAAYNHGLSNGDPITLVEDGGLPAELVDKQEYFVINVTAQTFQISLTLGGSAVAFTDDGTPDNYFCHVTGVSPSGWVIYTGLQPVSIIVNGWVSLQKSGSAQDAGVQLIMTSETFVETNGARGSKVTISNNISQGSQISDIVNRSRWEGIRIFAEGRTVSPDDLIATDSDLTFNIA